MAAASAPPTDWTTVGASSPTPVPQQSQPPADWTPVVPDNTPGPSGGGSFITPQQAQQPPPDWKPVVETSGLTNAVNTALPVVGNAVGTGLNDAKSALSTIAGHQDLIPILFSAAGREIWSNPNEKRDVYSLIAQDLFNPKSTVRQAFDLWRHDPTAAMDEYGAGSPKQNAWMKEHHAKNLSALLADHPIINAAVTFVEEGLNPMAAVEGLGAGKLLGLAGRPLGPLDAALGRTITNVAKDEKNLTATQRLTRGVGLGSPLYEIGNRGGEAGLNRVNALLNGQMAPAQFLKMEPTNSFVERVLGGLTPAEQTEVGRLSQGLKPDPQFFAKSGDLSRRAKLLRDDIEHITELKKQRKLIKPAVGSQPGQIRANYLPMKNSYDYPGNPTFAEELHTTGGPGAGGTEAKQKVFNNLDESIASGQLKDDFLLANNIRNWREAQMRRIAFEDAITNLPEALRLAPTKGLRAQLQRSGGVGPNGKQYVYAENPRNYRSSALRSGAVAPEFLHFIEQKFPSYIKQGTIVTGEHGGFGHKLMSLARNMIVAVNPISYHAMDNIAGNEAGARSLANLPGRMEFGGYLKNSARAVAQQLHVVDPKSFVGGAQLYSDWLDRALKEGATGAFERGNKSALGGETARVLTVPASGWRERLDKALTKYIDFNRNQTFGEPGEESFAVSLFKDASEHFQSKEGGGLSQAEADTKAGALTRQALHDLNNLDPNSPWNYVDFFMPWRKQNQKFWVGMLVKRPQTVTQTTHAIRNYNAQTAPDSLNSPYESSDFRLEKNPLTGGPSTVPFVGRDIGTLAGLGGDLANIITSPLLGGENTSPMQPIQRGVQLMTATTNPLAKMIYKGILTAGEQFNPQTIGPEKDYNQLVTNNAPPGVQMGQLARNALAQFPVPFASFVAQDAARRGWNQGDLAGALLMATNLGYPGQPKLTSGQRLQLKKAGKQLERAKYNYTYHGRTQAEMTKWNAAWTEYANKYESVAGIRP
ncbi:MAG: hypothetical protein KGL39_36610 [Patescibacteria group bacterium]|nr:hypothetical protein [Patescibacteria group bacterium]